MMVWSMALSACFVPTVYPRWLKSSRNFISELASGGKYSPTVRSLAPARSEPRFKYSPLGTYDVTCRMSSR